jgi:DNA-3-methyladenine glycosylase I
MVTTRRSVTASKLVVSKQAVAVKASKKSHALPTEAAPATAAAALAARSGGSWWFEYSGAMSEEYKRYMREEWGMEKRGDVPLFEKLSLEGAQAGLSWATILTKRGAYRAAFHDFDIKACAAMGDADVDALCARSGSGAGCIVRHRGKIASVANNARCVLRLAEEAEQRCEAQPPHGTLDALLWSFVNGAPQLNAWACAKQIPTDTETSHEMSKALKKLGFSFVGPKICYSLMQSCGLVIDHPKGSHEWEAARRRLDQRGAD